MFKKVTKKQLWVKKKGGVIKHYLCLNRSYQKKTVNEKNECPGTEES